MGPVHLALEEAGMPGYGPGTLFLKLRSKERLSKCRRLPRVCLLEDFSG